ncbi:hypothetical protein A1353_00215 [Methylomonas methanica]|uniref:Uncharacterized protein n=1 Tax=Methylomonas methanica TaxID=421 RepID=A0A177MHL6_METMH|nr:hypothetical protein [Methylomonas methanica]OAI05297.1 hypothetical protein A1353_00215 [Methylomonas methanica]
MAREVVTKRVYLKLAVFLDRKDAPTIQEKMELALKKLHRMGDRKEVLGEDNRHVRSIIYHRTHTSMLFGIFASYERGTQQMIVSEDDDAETLTIEQVAPPKGDDNKRREFLEGVCYFGLFGNHVLVVQSNALGSKQIETHFNWLLKQAEVVAAGNAVGLSDQIATATKERIRKAHVKEVEIGAPFIEAEAAPPSTNKEIVEDTAFNFKGIGLEMVRQILGDQLDSMKLADALDGNIEVSLRIRYKKKTTEKAHELLDNIALAIRNIDEDEVKLHLVGGGQVDGNQLKLSSQLRIEAHDGIPSYNELFQKMQQWLLDLLEKKVVEP